MTVTATACVTCGQVFEDNREICECGTPLGHLAPPVEQPLEPPEWADRPPELLEPVKLEVEIQKLSMLLEKVAPRLAHGIKRWGHVEATWQVQFHAQVLTIYQRHEEASVRVPAEDVRKAMAFNEMGPGLYQSRLSWQAEVEALERYADTLKTALSGRQTLLRRATGDS